MARCVLVGLPGTGKTTLARLLGVRWGCDAVDTDDVLSASMGCSAPEYLRAHGEVAFRRAELDALRLVVTRDAVVATGGGIVSTPEARELLKREVTVWLDCADDVILGRVGDVDRPLLGEDPASSLSRLRRQRTEWYREVAAARVSAEFDAEAVADLVEKALER